LDPENSNFFELFNIGWVTVSFFFIYKIVAK